LEGGCVQIGGGIGLAPSRAKAQSKRSSYRSAEALRHPKSTAAGEGARATRNQATSVRLNGAAKSRAPSKQPPSKQSLQNNVRIPSGGRRRNPTLQKTKGGHAALHRTRPPLTPLELTQRPREATRGKADLAGPESRERCGSRYNNPFPVARVRVFCSDFVTAAPNALAQGNTGEMADAVSRLTFFITPNL